MNKQTAPRLNDCDRITEYTVRDQAAASAYGKGYTQYRTLAVGLISLCPARTIKRMIKDRLDELNCRRYSSHPLHHHYETDLIAVAALVDVAQAAGVIPAPPAEGQPA